MPAFVALIDMASWAMNRFLAIDSRRAVSGTVRSLQLSFDQLDALSALLWSELK